MHSLASDTQQFSQSLNRLYALDVTVFDPHFPGENIVEFLRRNETIPEIAAFPDAAEIQAVLSHARTTRISQLAVLNPSDVKEQFFLDGAVEVATLLKCSGYDSFFACLTHNSPSYKLAALRFFMFEKHGKDDALAKGLSVAFKSIAEKGLADRVISDSLASELFQKLRIIVQGFAEVGGGEVSFSSLVFVTPFLTPLLNCKASDREVFIEKMLKRDYPFSTEPSTEWISEITSK